MDKNIFDLLIQLPIVGVFIWYSLEMNKRIQKITDAFTSSLEKHDASVDRRVNALIEAQNQTTRDLITEIKSATVEMQKHDEYVKTNVSVRRRAANK